MIVAATIFAEFITYDKNQTHHTDYFSATIGLVGYFGIFMHSQKIIDDNSFRQFAFVGLAILVASIIKQALTGYSLLPLFSAGLPLLFVGYFRVLTSLFYKGYPNSTTMPTVIFATKLGQTYFDGKDEGYKPPMKERVFSLLLFMGFMFYAFGLLWFIKNIILTINI
jgi:predicted membrane channel-forming protein YqfA (hemolysin III family)